MSVARSLTGTPTDSRSAPWPRPGTNVRTRPQYANRARGEKAFPGPPRFTPDQTSWLPDNLLERADRMTMAASIEARVPFLDHELAAFVSALPDRFRVRGRRTKWILREAARHLLP